MTHYLYNVYSNGFNPNIPTANPGTLNFASELGLFCRPQGATEIDPATGINYLAEIQHIIEGQGDYPLSAGASSGVVNQTPIDEGAVTHPASALVASTPYASWDTAPTDPDTGETEGFCTVSSTDGNTGS